MGRIAAASGLENVTAIVQFGTISVAYDPGPDAEPITLLRVARRTSADYGRLAGSAELARRLYESRMSVDDALDEVERLENAAPPYPGWVTWLAAGVAAGGSTVLFGGGPAEVAVAALATVAARPALAWLTSVGLPTFFRNVIGPAIAVVIVMGLFALGLPYSAPIAVTGAIMIFLPGGALAAGMRDLIDGSIVSGRPASPRRSCSERRSGSGSASGSALPRSGDRRSSSTCRRSSRSRSRPRPLPRRSRVPPSPSTTGSPRALSCRSRWSEPAASSSIASRGRRRSTRSSRPGWPQRSSAAREGGSRAGTGRRPRSGSPPRPCRSCPGGSSWRACWRRRRAGAASSSSLPCSSALRSASERRSVMSWSRRSGGSIARLSSPS